jgi:MFS family permease
MFEPFSTLLLKCFTPRTWMSRIMLTWGIITMCVGATKNFGGLFACRLLLGLAEAGFGPGVMFHLSFWYPTDQLPFRIAIMSALTVFSASLSGLLGYGVSFMNGQAGLAGWRWLFIFSGAPAILCGLYTMIKLPNYPETATFLTPAERMAIQNRLPKSQPSSTDKTWSCREVKSLFKDYSTYTFLLIWTCHAVGAFGVVTVLPTVIYELGLSSTAVSQLMTMPPAVIGAGCLMLIAWQVQRRNIKSWLAAAILESLSGACNIVLIIVEQPLVRYVFIVLSLIFAIGVLPILWPERIKATSGTTSAGLAIGLTGALASLRGIVGPYIWMQRFGPSYRTSFSVSLALIGLALVGIATTRVLVNRKTREIEKSGIVTSNSESSQDSIPKAPFARLEKLRY